MLEILQYLKNSIENNENFVTQFEIDVDEHPNSYHKWKNYYKAGNEIDYAKKLIRIIEKKIELDVKHTLKH